jgi:hypothetical protein
MTPKEKADELYWIYYQLVADSGHPENLSKELALITVDNVKWFHQRLFYLTEGSIFDKYLQDVKEEIEKL